MRRLHITGYDTQSGLLVLETTLPTGVEALVREIAHIPPHDGDLLGAYPLDGSQIAALAPHLPPEMASAPVNFFLEAYVDDVASGQQAA